MSEILLATNPDNPVIIGTSSTTPEEKGKQLPKPAGYKILFALPEVDKEFEQGLLKADETIMIEETLATVLFVVALGPDCYKDPKRFPSGPWCKEGDFVLVRPNAGQRLVIHGREFRMINDDTVDGTVDDPRGIRRK
jgi:co-chaperonin GroES (HSP10)